MIRLALRARVVSRLGEREGEALDKGLFKKAAKVLQEIRAEAKAQAAASAENEEWDQIDLMRELVSWVDQNIEEIEGFQNVVKQDSPSDQWKTEVRNLIQYKTNERKLLNSFSEEWSDLLAKNKTDEQLIQFGNKAYAKWALKKNPYDFFSLQKQRKEWDSKVWWDELKARCHADCPELGKYSPTGGDRKIGPTISPGIQVDIIHTAHRCYCRLLSSKPENFDLLFPDQSKKDDFENSVDGRVKWNVGTKSHISATIRTVSRMQESEVESVEAILKIYKQIRDWVQANLSE